MKFENICGIIDVKDRQVCAYIDICLKKMEEDKRITIELVQTLASSYAQNMVESFIQTNKEFLSDETNRTNVKKHLVLIGADKPYSGKRFSEELYKALPSIEFNKDGSEEKEKE